ncbi:MAG: universal stress protein [Burkholderiaceae bacterium]|jgi:nucleotide-binding universal stress UspA family protein
MYQRILVPVDGSPPSNRGLAEAIEIAKLTGGRLRLVSVVDMFVVAMGVGVEAGYPGDLVPMMREGGHKILAVARAQAEAAGVGVDTVLREDFAVRVCEVVVAEATAWPADLIVIGTHGRRGVGRLLLGSDAEQILRLAPVPVLLVRAPETAGS